MLRSGIFGLLFLVGYVQPALADHWIAVASFKNRDTAEKGLLQTRTKTSEVLAVVATPSASGINYRVSAGPYATLGEAKRALPRLHEAGLSGAWIWKLERFANDASEVRQPPTQTRLSSAFADIDDLDFVDLDRVALMRESRALESMGSGSAQSDVQDAPQQAPPGYQLNRLRRDN
jgi:hypothetical protein